MGDVGRYSYYVVGVSGNAEVNLSLEAVVQFDAIEVRSATSGESKMKSRTEIRRADKTDLKNEVSNRLIGSSQRPSQRRQSSAMSLLASVRFAESIGLMSFALHQ